MEQQRLRGLQVARACAALGIAYFHSWYALMQFPKDTAYPIPLLRDYGWLSVDFFFAISGFVIAMMMAKPKFSAVSFAIKRVFRLYPLWIVTTLVFVVICMRIRGFAPNETTNAILYSLTLLPTHGFPFYSLGWSLQHEMAFYALATVVALLSPASARLYVLILVMSVLAIIGLLMGGHPGNHDDISIIRNLLSYYPCFLAGLIAYIIPRKEHFGFWTPFLISIGAFAFLINVWGGRPYYPIALFFLLVAFVNLRVPNSRIGNIAVVMGDASYSIYLIHHLVYNYTYGRLTEGMPIWSQELFRFGSILATCIIAYLSWRLFETPINKLGHYLATLAAKVHRRKGEMMVTAPTS